MASTAITPESLMDNFTSAISANKSIIVMGFTVIFIGTMLFTLFDNPSALNTQTYIYAFTLIIPLVIAGGMLLNLDKIGTTAIAIIVGLILFMVGIMYAYSTMNSSYFPAINFFLNIIIFLSIAIALAIVYNIIKDNLNKIEGTPGLILGILFYIPCMISDFISYLMQQYSLTPNVVFVLFILEIILILLYIYLPKLLTKILVPPKLVLQNTPLFLDSRVVIADAKALYPDLAKSQSDLLAFKSPYTKNYCLSMWIFINPHNASNAAYAKETEIFNYNNSTGNSPKPKITYSYDSVNGLDQYFLYFDKSSNSMKISVVGQKWNQFVFNYNNNSVDVFINGNLERSFPMKANLPEYDNTDTITVGAANGLDGAICNIIYSNPPLTKYEIANSYNLLMNKNPPINVE